VDAAIPSDRRRDYPEAETRVSPRDVEPFESRPARVETFVYPLQAIAALHGCTRTARIIEGFVDGEFIPRCPADQCGVEIYVSIEGASMFATLEDPATDEVGERMEITRPSHTGDVGSGAWSDAAVLPLLANLARRVGHDELAEKLALWNGSITCPKCREPFVLRTTLLNPTDL